MPESRPRYARKKSLYARTDNETLEEILEASDQLMGVIYKIRLRRKQQADREKTGKRFVI